MNDPKNVGRWVLIRWEAGLCTCEECWNRNVLGAAQTMCERSGANSSDAATRLRCDVCGEVPGWSFPRVGDRCWNDDGGRLVPDPPAEERPAANGLDLAQAKAGLILRQHRGSIRAAFDSLETGVTFEELTQYVERDFHAKSLARLADDPERFHARLCGLIAGAALTIVQADRRAGLDVRFRQRGGAA